MERHFVKVAVNVKLIFRGKGLGERANQIRMYCLLRHTSDLPLFLVP